jgi:TatA/E family protein of Tat protein translocase
VGSIGPAEIVIVLIVGLIVLGPTRLPEAARQMGKAVTEFRKMTSGLQAEVRDAFAEPVPGTPPVPPAPTSAAVAGVVAEVADQPSAGPAPWANPPIDVAGPSPISEQ